MTMHLVFTFNLMDISESLFTSMESTDVNAFGGGGSNFARRNSRNIVSKFSI
jgi:hypothetical protein